MVVRIVSTVQTYSSKLTFGRRKPRGASTLSGQSCHCMIRTSEVPVVLLSATSLAVLAVCGPVGHATQLVALGKGSIWDTIANRLSGDRGAP